MSNYPDDIGNSRNHPLSPIYEEPIDWCDECGGMIDEDGLCKCDEVKSGD